MIDIGVLYLVFSISMLGMGVFSSLRDGDFFYTAVCLINIIAWWQAIIMEEK